MRLAWAAAAGVTSIAMWLSAAAPQRTAGWVREYPTPLTREEAAVTVNGIEEIWALRWKSAPKPECAEHYMAITCPCTGFEYGESGDLELVRMRGRIVFDRIALAPFFEDEFGAGRPVAIVPRWPLDDKDSDETDQAELQAEVRKRPAVRLMNFGDYDHDGQATEFQLTRGTIACGQTSAVVVGVSKVNPRLHVFGTAAHPDEPFALRKEEWEALRDATGPIDVVSIYCGDHGIDSQIEARLWWTTAGITGRARTYDCVDGREKGKLISEEPL